LAKEKSLDTLETLISSLAIDAMNLLQNRAFLVVVCCFSFSFIPTSFADENGKIKTGSDKIVVELGGNSVEVFTYKPRKYRDGPLLVVCHGKLRTAERYRDSATVLADRAGAIVVAPYFDLERYSVEAYQHGGVFKSGKLQAPDDWTVSLVPQLVAEIRRREGNSKLPYYLLGHSGGGQFLVRLAGLTSADAARIVAANPGTHLFPTRDVPYPHGFGGLPEKFSDDAALRKYLARPLTLYLGTDDKGDESLSMAPEAVRQGATRIERGRNCFRFASELAKKNGWEFNWRLVEAPGVAHDARAMFSHKNAMESLAIEPSSTKPR
jgi:poly(3-hydroxybutyrate) depolymerase